MQKGPRDREPLDCDRAIGQCLISGGSLPPFAASFDITCLCSQTFMLAESLLSPVYPSSFASSFRAVRLESMSSAFIRSTIEVRHCSFSPLAAAARSTIAATSTDCAGDGDDGAAAEPEPPAAPAAGAPAPPGAASALEPNIAPMIFPKMLTATSNG